VKSHGTRTRSEPVDDQAGVPPPCQRRHPRLPGIVLSCRDQVHHLRRRTKIDPPKPTYPDRSPIFRYSRIVELAGFEPRPSTGRLKIML
jgi:hypothetical protein